jgi:hydrogenase/urease accessory protein HupE
MSNVFVSLIRTWVPVAVGAIIGWVLSLGIFDVSAEDQAKVTATAVAAAIALYHGLVRYLERKWPVFGWLLGSAKQPEYVTGTPKVQAEA